MKKISRMLIISLVICSILIGSSAFAGERYVHTKSFTFRNDSTRALNGASAEIYIGKKNVVEYQKDISINISPAPKDIKEDEFGNMYAIYDFSEYKPGRTIDIKVDRIFESMDYSGEAIPVRTESTVTRQNELYTRPQDKIESDDASILAKAKEITYGYSSDYKRARAIFEYINTNISYDKSNAYANKGALSALENKKGVCEEFATLYAALCRSIEIPCKVIEGYRIQKEVDKPSETILDDKGKYITTETTYKYSIIPHVWNEVYFDDYGWVPVDTCDIYVTPSGTHVSTFDTFCNIKSKEYIAVGMYSKRSSEIAVFTEKFTLVSSEETYDRLDNIEVEEEHSFSDLNGYKWAEDAINALYKMQVIKGYSDAEFGPGGNISRIEFIAMYSRLLRNLKYTPSSYGRVYYYLDYNTSHYSKTDYDYFMRLLEDASPFDKMSSGYGAMNSIFGSSLNMNKPITRGEVVALMGFFLKTGKTPVIQFTDLAGYPFASQVTLATSNGLIKGYEDGSFKPNNPITRAEMAVILDRYVGERDYTI